MAVEVTKCRYCKRGIPRRHHPDCPALSGEEDPIALADWEKGYRTGIADETIAWYLLGSYSKAFQLGYRIGKAVVDELVDEAAQSRIFG